ncbi:MAG: hypothetical protein AAGD32_04075 [Planctomycetota bacterium]
MGQAQAGFVFIAEGKLFVRLPGERMRELVSPFAEDFLARSEASAARNEWKSGSAGWNSGAGGFGLLGGGEAQIEPVKPMTFHTVAAHGSTIYYGMSIGRTNGLFRHELDQEDEYRMAHGPDWEVRDIAPHPDGRLLYSRRDENGSANLHVFPAGGGRPTPLTEGDTLDEAPSWDGDAILYHAIGIARTADGFIGAYGPATIERLDPEDGSVTTLVEDPAFDYLNPMRDPAGRLHAIRRPYKPDGEPISMWVATREFFLFPFRLGAAVLHFANAFTQFFSNKPMVAAGGASHRVTPPRRLMLRNQMISADKAARKASTGQPPPIVPKDWQLVRFETDRAEPEVLAEHVGSFALDGGDVVYADGSNLHRLAADGTASHVTSATLISAIAVMQ